ncbi:MAG: hypothetical protein SGILL_000898 [Bacillariaceae sp.]
MADHDNNTTPVHPPSPPNPSRIASCALHFFDRKLQGKKGKPKPNEEWTVYAAIVAHQAADDAMWVVSCATGTKCTSYRCNGCVLHDAHAEVLARRGLIRVLWGEIRKLKQNQTTESNRNGRPLLVPSSSTASASSPTSYRLNPHITLHFYISDSPCGDASIYQISSAASDKEGAVTDSVASTPSQFTGAKVIVSQATGVTSEDCGGSHQLLSTSAGENGNSCDQQPTSVENESAPTQPSSSTTVAVAREDIQVLGKLRTKSGRSNLPDHLRSTSMSCSDKIALWSVLGVQGSFLTHFLDRDAPMVCLTSVVVSRDPRLYRMGQACM